MNKIIFTDTEVVIWSILILFCLFLVALVIGQLRK